MQSSILNIIQSEFKGKEIEKAKSILNSITLDHVMAASETNLLNTQRAILTLAKGDLHQLKTYTENAKIDFRDVILWAMEDSKL